MLHVNTKVYKNLFQNLDRNIKKITSKDKTMAQPTITLIDKIKLEHASEIVPQSPTHRFVQHTNLRTTTNTTSMETAQLCLMPKAMSPYTPRKPQIITLPPNSNCIPNSRGTPSIPIQSSLFTSRADSSIWKLAWSHPRFGDLIAVGSFTRRVAVFQLKPSSPQAHPEWVEVAHHVLHEGSVNEVHWAPEAYGLKLYACSSDGTFSLLQLSNGQWTSRLFKGHELSINSLAIQSQPFLAGVSLNTKQIQFQQTASGTYPLIVTGSKDKSIGLWKYNKELQEYQRVLSHVAHKQAIRNVLWRNSLNADPVSQIFTCSEVKPAKLQKINYNISIQDGAVKIIQINSDSQAVSEIVLMQEHSPVLKLSQSLTGSSLIASVEEKGVNRSITFYENEGEWLVGEHFQA